MLIRVDPSSDRAIYAQIADSVRASIAAGRVHAGDTLPPARVLAQGLEVNQHTVLHAYQLLRDEGIVDLRRGRGAVVTQLAAGIAELYASARDLVARAAALGVAPSALAAMMTHAEGLTAGSPADPSAEPDARGREQNAEPGREQVREQEVER